MSNIPNLVYHYTSIEAFQAIVESQSLRMTRYDRLNDPMEIILTVELLSKHLKIYKCKLEDNAYREYVIDFLRRYKNFELYLTSFSEHKDLLDQWRAYTPQGGISIGFDSSKLIQTGFYDYVQPEGERNDDGSVVDIINEHGQGRRSVTNPCKCWPCEYLFMEDEEKTIKHIEQLVNNLFKEDSYIAAFKRVYEEGVSSPIPEEHFHAPFNVHMFRLLTTIKHSAYSNEKEWRFVNIFPPEDKFPLDLDENNRLYVLGKIHPGNFIKEVWISPHGDTDSIRHSLIYYRRKADLNFDIRESTLPYRLTRSGS